MTAGSKAPREQRAPREHRAPREERVHHGQRPPLQPGPDDALNDQIQALMRQAADQLAERTRAQAAADTESARLQLDAIIALAKSRDRATR